MNESRTSHRNRRIAATVGVAVALFGAGALAATSAPTANTTDTLVRSSTNRPLPQTGAAKTTVLALHLPAGKWVLSSTGDFVGYGVTDYTRCWLRVGTTAVAGVTAVVGASAAGGVGAGSITVPFALEGGVSLSSTSSVVLTCWHDNNRASAPYVDAGATLWAHKTSSLSKFSY